MIKPKKILILGFSREGASTLAYLRGIYGNIQIDIFDQKRLTEIDDKWKNIISNDANLNLFLGIKTDEFLNKQDTNYDLIIKTAGIPNKIIPKKLWPEITTQTKIFFEKCRGKIIAITGTKGKSTTSGLIHEILKTANLKTVFVGNIGKPCLEYLDIIDKDTFVVFEISSHQLCTMNKSPKIAVFLNIYKEHLDYYENYDDYFMAKANIIKFQTAKDFFVYNSNFSEIKKLAVNAKSKAIPFDKKDLDFSTIKTRLLGVFNQNNIKAAWITAGLLKINDPVIKKAVENFIPLKHRLEKVGKFKDITFYNDSLATIPEATMAALDTFGDRVETLIAGGFDRGLSYKLLSGRILQSRIHNLILFPTTGEKILKELTDLNKDIKKSIKVMKVDKMEDAVTLAYKYTRKNKICLLSCASSSFNLFKDYADRGEQFRKNVMEKGVC